MHLGKPSNRFGRYQRPRSDFERVDLTGLDEFVDGAAADTERSGGPVYRVCDLIHGRLRWVPRCGGRPDHSRLSAGGSIGVLMRGETARFGDHAVTIKIGSRGFPPFLGNGG